jgi:hypothetical protein
MRNNRVVVPEEYFVKCSFKIVLIENVEMTSVQSENMLMFKRSK